MNKKGVEISMNVIIIAAIGLLVLVVLSIIFLGKTGVWSRSTGECGVQGGTCASTCTVSDIGEGYTKNPLLTCANNAAGETQVCCLPIKA